MADRYISDKCLPDKAIDLIDEAAAQLKIESNIKPEIILLKEERKIQSIENKLNNLSMANLEEKEKLLNIKQTSEDKLNEISERWNNLRGEMEQLSFLMKQEDAYC